MVDLGLPDALIPEEDGGSAASWLEVSAVDIGCAPAHFPERKKNP
ncbi:hypothetical protein [Pseudomonas sp. LB3P31]